VHGHDQADHEAGGEQHPCAPVADRLLDHLIHAVPGRATRVRGQIE